MVKKLSIKLVAVAAVAVLLFISAFIAQKFENKHADTNVYNLTAEVDGAYLEGQLELEYFNNNAFNVTELYFCLYPNAFKNEENILNVAIEDRIEQAYPNGFSAGYIDIKQVKINDKNVEFSLIEDQQILKIETETIKKGENKKIYIEFEEKLPESPMRYGYGGDTYNFGNWYPVLCPFDNSEPVLSRYLSNGDPFYSECADYNVTLSIPSDFRVATSGRIIEKNTKNPINTEWRIKGENIRDFAFCISSGFELKSKAVGNTLVYSYYHCDDTIGERVLDYAVDALTCFNNLFGEYPYSTLSVAAADFYIGGMEYPNMVLVNKELYSDISLEALEEVVVHEVAHQWWYGVVGNNEIKEPWLDEGLTQYSVALYYEHIYGIERYKSFMQENESYCDIVFSIVDEINGSVSKRIERASNDFEHWLLYDAVTYDVTALMLDSVRTSIGDVSFFSGLKYYYENNRYKVATKNSFINDMKAGSGKNISGIVEPWLQGSIYWG